VIYWFVGQLNPRVNIQAWGIEKHAKSAITWLSYAEHPSIRPL